MSHYLQSLGAVILTTGIFFTLNITPVQAATVTLNDAVSVPINETTTGCATPITRTFTVTDTFSIQQLQLGFNANHTYRGDIQLTLTHEFGGTSTSVVAIASNGADSNDNYDILIASGNTNPLDDNINDDINAPLYDRTVGASNSLGPFLGQTVSGTWTIEICDVFNLDNGIYNSLQLVLSDVVPYSIDLDQNNSSGADGSNFMGSFDITAGGPVAAADSDVLISNSGNLNTATITLTNRPDGTSESLDVNLTGGGDLTKTYNSATGVLTVSSASGIAPSTLATVLSTLTYDNTDANIDAGNRIITVSVRQVTGDVSNEARSTIAVFHPNPDLDLACNGSTLSLDALFILDDSGSINANELDLQRQAVIDTIDYFLNNNIAGQIAIARFSTNSSVVLDYTPITIESRDTMIDALNNNYGPPTPGAGQLTNWEAGLSLGNSLAGRVNPDLAFFFTDGTQNSGGSPIDEATVFKENGTHMYTIGIDELGDQPNSDIDFFRDLTDGPNTALFNGSNTRDADYLPISDFSQLRDELSGLISTFCPIPNVLLVKRITAINGQSTNPNDQVDLSSVIDATTGPYADADSNPRWPMNYLRGEIDGGAIQPGDTIEFTLYFYNVGAGDAEDVYLCDRLQPYLRVVTDAYGAAQDFELELGNDPSDASPNLIVPLTAAKDGIDRAQLIAPGASVPSQCNINGANSHGTVMLELTGTSGAPVLPNLPGSSGPNTTDNAYGSFRFIVKVEE